MTMKRSKFTEAQIAFVLRQAEEGTAVGEVCRKAGISEGTFYIYGLLPVARRLKTWLTWSSANIYPASPDDGAPIYGLLARGKEAQNLVDVDDCKQRHRTMVRPKLGNPLTPTSTIGRPRRPL
jgi:putative transposase